MSRFWKRLRERKMVQWALAYLAGVWLVVQIVDVFGQNLGWPGWIFRSAVAALAVGFLAAMVVAWYHGERGRQRMSGVELALLAGILAMAGAAVMVVRGDPPGLEPPGLRDGAPDVAPAGRIDAAGTVAVLPFANLSGDPEVEGFVRGIHDDLLTQLSMLGALRVISRTSVERYRETERTIPEIGRELGASWILQGGIQRSGDRIRMNAQLLDAEADVHVWAERYDLRLTVENIFQIQADLARNIASALQAELSPEEETQLGRAPTEDLEAYNHYRTGRHLADRRSTESLGLAVVHFQRAIELDPTYGRAYAGMADAYTQMGTWGLIPGDEAFPAASDAARNALRVDPLLGDAWASLGYIHYWYDWDWEAAESAFRRAIELSPSYSTAHHWYSLLLVTLNRFGEARAALDRAVELDPLSRIIRTIKGRLHWLSGEADHAVEEHRRALELDPAYAVGHMWLGLAHESLGEVGEAVRHYGRAAELDRESPVLLAGLARAHVLSGEAGRAMELLEDLRRRGGGESPVPFWTAVVHAGLGRRDAAFDELELAFRSRDGWLTEVGVTPLLEPIRPDPRYAALLRRLDLTQ